MEGTSTTSKIADILEILSDGKWHRLEEIQRVAEMDEDQVHWITEFLMEYMLIVPDGTKKKVKLDKTAQKFLTQPATA